jgi:polyisoprenoid-binding protein YceI
MSMHRLIRGVGGYICVVLVTLVAGTTTGQAQGKYMTQKGTVSFFSTSIIEDIEAHTEQTAALVDLQTGQLAFSIPIRSFQFKRTLMQEHFNENYMESERFPKATFKGKVVAYDPEMLAKAGPQRVTVEGDLTIHGVTKHLSVVGALEQLKGTLLVNAYFSVAPADYGIEIPLLVRENIAKVVGVKVLISCDPVSQLTAK